MALALHSFMNRIVYVHYQPKIIVAITLKRNATQQYIYLEEKSSRIGPLRARSDSMLGLHTNSTEKYLLVLPATPMFSI